MNRGKYVIQFRKRLGRLNSSLISKTRSQQFSQAKSIGFRVGVLALFWLVLVDDEGRSDMKFH